MLQNWNDKYFSHNSNINCLGLPFKYISFEPIYYSINFVFSSIVFSDIDSMFLSNVLLY